MMKKSTKISSLMLAICFSLGLIFPVSWAIADVKTDINTATIEQLEMINGVGQDTAKNILDYKKEHGKFQSMEELEAVKGVGQVRLQALSEAFTVESTKKNN